MADETVVASAVTTPTENAPAVETSILGNADQPVVSKDESILDTAGQQDKAEKDAENSRLMKADPATLSPEDGVKREALVKAEADTKAKALEAEKAKGVPEKYDIKAPVGSTLDEARLGKAVESFKENGFTNKQAQSMVDLFVGMQKVANDEATTNFKTFMEKSAEETMKALNTDGRSAKVELGYVAKMKNLFSPETLEILNTSGMGNQKSFIMDLAKIGRLFSEEKNVDTGRGSAGGKDAADILYPNMSK